MKKQKLIIITGPTGIGKSDLAISLAKRFNGEIIGADSMQIYKGMDIGTGKTPLDQRQGIAHHMIDIVDPKESYSVGAFTADAKAKIADISSRGNVPILVGGTGLYISSLLAGHTFARVERDEEFRKGLQEKEASTLHEELKKIDPVSADLINANDKKRIIRALEIFHISGKPKSEQVDSLSESEYDYLLIVLTADRAWLYGKIEARVDKMFALGLADEVGLLNAKCGKDTQSMQAIGYKDVIDFVEGRATFVEASERLKMNSRRYAKRQITYFKNMPLNKEFFDVSKTEEIAERIAQFLN